MAWEYGQPRSVNVDFEDGFLNNGRSADLDRGTVGIGGIAEQKITCVENNLAVGFSLQRKKVVLFHKYLLLHIVNKIHVDLLRAPKHEVQIQILPMGFPKPILRDCCLILHNVDKQLVTVNGMAAFFIAEEVMVLGIGKSSADILRQKIKIFQVANVAKYHSRSSFSSVWHYIVGKAPFLDPMGHKRQPAPIISYKSWYWGQARWCRP